VSVLARVLRVRKITEQRAAIELGQVNRAQTSEKAGLVQLEGFLQEYTIEKTIEGRKIEKHELLNQNKFVGTIVKAEHLQHKKIEKLALLYSGKARELTLAKNVVSKIEEKLKVEKAQKMSLKQKKEDAQNAEVFTNRKRYD
jgi:hypothetical protein